MAYPPPRQGPWPCTCFRTPFGLQGASRPTPGDLKMVVSINGDPHKMNGWFMKKIRLKWWNVWFRATPMDWKPGDWFKALDCVQRIPLCDALCFGWFSKSRFWSWKLSLGHAVMRAMVVEYKSPCIYAYNIYIYIQIPLNPHCFWLIHHQFLLVKSSIYLAKSPFSYGWEIFWPTRRER